MYKYKLAEVYIGIVFLFNQAWSFSPSREYFFLFFGIKLNEIDIFCDVFFSTKGGIGISQFLVKWNHTQDFQYCSDS